MGKTIKSLRRNPDAPLWRDVLKSIKAKPKLAFYFAKPVDHGPPAIAQRVARLLGVAEDEMVLVAPLAHLVDPVAGPANHLMIGGEHDELLPIAATLNDMPCHPWRRNIDNLLERSKLANAPV